MDRGLTRPDKNNVMRPASYFDEVELRFTIAINNHRHTGRSRAELLEWAQSDSARAHEYRKAIPRWQAELDEAERFLAILEPARQRDRDLAEEQRRPGYGEGP
jgi:hypothetical protein